MKLRDELYLGIDLGGTNVRAAVVDPVGHVLGQEKHRLLSREPPQVAEAVVRAAKTACGAAGLPFTEMKGMGIGGGGGGGGRARAGASRHMRAGITSRRGRGMICASRWRRRGRRGRGIPRRGASCWRSSASRKR